MKIEKYIKTECGKTRYHELKKEYDKNIVSKARFIIYIIIASIRDIFK